MDRTNTVVISLAATGGVLETLLKYFGIPITIPKGSRRVDRRWTWKQVLRAEYEISFDESVSRLIHFAKHGSAKKHRLQDEVSNFIDEYKIKTRVHRVELNISNELRYNVPPPLLLLPANLVNRQNLVSDPEHHQQQLAETSTSSSSSRDSISSSSPLPAMIKMEYIDSDDDDEGIRRPNKEEQIDYDDNGWEEDFSPFLQDDQDQQVLDVDVADNDDGMRDEDNNDQDQQVCNVADNMNDEDMDLSPSRASTSSSILSILQLVPVTLPTRNDDRISVGLKLFAGREGDAWADMSFVLPDVDPDDDQLFIRAHMLIVREGSITLKQMIQRRKDAIGNGDSGIQIQLPRIGAGLTIYTTFLKFLYDVDTLPPPSQLTDDLLCKLLLLGDYFAVQGLYEKCCSILRGRLSQENCVEIFETTLQLSVKNELVDLAFQTVLENFDALLSPDNNMAMVDWSWKTWQYLLPHLFGEQLVTAFKALKRWKDHDPMKRDEIFPRLGKCIRFRSFGLVAAADALKSSGILRPLEMVALFMHFAGGQTALTVDPSQDLQQILDTSQPGSEIRLSPGVFQGVFVISRKGIKVIGAGPPTKIRGQLIVDADECEVADLSVVVASPLPRSCGHDRVGGRTLLALTSGGGEGSSSSVILIKRNFNALSNLEILLESKNGGSLQNPSPTTMATNRAKKCRPNYFPSAIMCTGNHNNFTNIMTHLPTISITGDDNRLDAIIFRSTSNGVVIQGDKNIVSDVMFFPSSDSSSQQQQQPTNPDASALNIAFGRENVVTNLNVFQHPPNNNSSSVEVFLLRLGQGSAFTRVRNCTGASVQMDGAGHEVVGVKLSPRFKFGVKGTSHQFVDCGAEKFQNSGKNVTMTTCGFY